MRIFEIIILVSLFITLSMTLVKKPKCRKLADILTVITILTIILHFLFEGYRWQMMPAYCLNVILFVLLLIRIAKRHSVKEKQSRRQKALRIIFFALGLMIVGISARLSWMFPVFELPKPTGKFSVGTNSWYLSDKSRPESLTEDPSDVRQIMVRAWYPADINKQAKAAPYISHTDTFSEDNKMPGFFYDYMHYIKTHSYLSVPVSSKEFSYPVLIFSHGLGCTIDAYTALMEELASHGYIVFSIGHTYNTPTIWFPDGKKARPKQNISFSSSENESQISETLKELSSTDDISKQKILFQKLYSMDKVANSNLPIWTEDTKFVIDWLEKSNNSDMADTLFKKLNVNQLGVFGMSFGGATAEQITINDKRVKACINMDGLHFGGIVDHPIKVPFMFMRSDRLPSQYDKLDDIIYKMAQNTIYSATVKGSSHTNYTDMSIWYHPEIGTIDGNKMLNITNLYTLAFFDKHLKGIDSPLLKGASPDYPEVIFKVWNQ